MILLMLKEWNRKLRILGGKVFSSTILYDKKKELSKTILTSKARAIDNSNNIITNKEDIINSIIKNNLQDFS